MVIEEWFSTPIWYDVFKNISSEQYDEAIVYCKYLQTNTPGRVRSNVGGWQSENLYYENIIDTPLQVYFDILAPHIKQAFQDIGVEREHFLANIWININQTGNGNRQHAHPGSSLSGVFYLTKNNSSIVFTRNQDIPWFHLSNLKSNNNTKLSFNDVAYTPMQGQYIIFPSWLHHRVMPNQNDCERISIAFNLE
jgi:uncharacterized protein (TIGR02466 family)